MRYNPAVPRSIGDAPATTRSLFSSLDPETGGASSPQSVLLRGGLIGCRAGRMGSWAGSTGGRTGRMGCRAVLMGCKTGRWGVGQADGVQGWPNGVLGLPMGCRAGRWSVGLADGPMGCSTA